MIVPVIRTIDITDRELPDIIIAAYAGNCALVSALLQEGVDVNSVDPDDNLSILHIACLQGDKALVNLLLEHDKAYHNVDFSIRSLHRPRLAWQFAMNGNFFDIAQIVDQAGLDKQHRAQKLSPNPSGP